MVLQLVNVCTPRCEYVEPPCYDHPLKYMRLPPPVPEICEYCEPERVIVYPFEPKPDMYERHG